MRKQLLEEFILFTDPPTSFYFPNNIINFQYRHIFTETTLR